jgi:hypothetical protein
MPLVNRCGSRVSPGDAEISGHVPRKTSPSLIEEDVQLKENLVVLEVNKIYGYGSPRGSIPLVNVLASCQQQASATHYIALQI